MIELAKIATHRAAALWLPPAAYITVDVAAQLATSIGLTLGSLIDLTAAARLPGSTVAAALRLR